MVCMCMYVCVHAYMYVCIRRRYSADYLQVMVRQMRKNKAGLVKLSGWFVYSCKLHYFGYFDPGKALLDSIFVSEILCVFLCRN
jgi:hypothetical protein